VTSAGTATEEEGVEIVLATSNPGKLTEIRAILGELPLVIRPLSDFPGVILPEEGEDYEENAITKARVAAKVTGYAALADDSGLEVAGLGGAPGPLSARYGGPGLDDSGRVGALLEALANSSGEQRRARFVCIAALATPDGELVTARGECAGQILPAPRGCGGFGYDPVFEVEGSGRAMAEFSSSEKNQISHRARAFIALSGAIRAQIRLAPSA
jgi:XTP/dITP diphosphohydrolase